MRATRHKFAVAVVMAAFGWAVWTSPAQAQDSPQQATAKQETPATEKAAQDFGVSKHALLWGETFQDAHFFTHAIEVGTHSIGVAVVPADATLRAQLGLPAEEGLVVTNVDLNSAAWEAGVAQHDVLLRLAEKPLAIPGDLTKQVDAVGEKPAGLVIIRNGKRITLQVKPRPAAHLAATQEGRVLWRLAAANTTRFWIGLELAPAEETLRAQLKLPEGQGVVVTNVIDDSPAAKAGIQKHDVMLILDYKPVASSDELRAKVQEVGEKPAGIKLIREGKPISIQVTPQKHTAQEDQETLSRFIVKQGKLEQPLIWDVVRPAAIAGKFRVHAGQGRRGLVTDDLALAAEPADPQSRLQELIDQVKELQKKVEALSEDLKKPTPVKDSPEKK